MRLLFLPGMDGTGLLFEPMVKALPPSLTAHVVAYPPDQPLGYNELLQLIQKAADEGGDFVVVGESFSGPLALMLAVRRPVGLGGVVLCASFVRFPLPVPERWRGAVRPGCWEVGSVCTFGREGGCATRAALSSPSGPSRVRGRTGLFLRSGVSGGSAERIADLIRPKPD